MSGTADDEADITVGALNYIARAAPERETSIRKIFFDHSIRVRHTPDIEFVPGIPPEISPHALYSTIRWPPLMHTLMWLLAHGGWEVMRDYGSVILAGYESGTSNFRGEDVEEAALSLEAREKGLRAIECAKDTALGKEVTLPTWLPNIGDESSQEHSAVRELWLMATVWMLLHEFHHVLFEIEHTHFAEIIDEEWACDAGASHWLLSDVDGYCAVSKEAAEKVRGKRAMGALIGLFCVGWLSDREGSASHPSLSNRVTILLGEVGEKEAGRFWQFAAGLMYVLARDRTTITFSRPATFRELVLELAKHLA